MEKSFDLLVLPHQLYTGVFDYPRVILWEHPQYFTKYKYNKKRLILHRASMQTFKKALETKGVKVEYLTYKESPAKSHEYIMFDPIDNLKGLNPVETLESPNFLLTKSLMESYDKGFYFKSFYKWAKKQVDIIPDISSQDKHNRKSLPKSLKDIPPKYITEPDKDTIDSAIEYLKGDFAENYGDFADFDYPIDRESALKELNHFLDEKLCKFGPYQDAIDTDNFDLFHSRLSAVINIGLIQPGEIIEKFREIEPKKSILSSYEGYIRQLFWREYQRYCYIYFKLPAEFIFDNNKKLTKEWYEGNTGVTPLDDAIKTAFKTGYLHHILRLMVVGAYMNMSGIKPTEGHKWFMEFACDSYLWVMHQNVFEMAFFVAGKTMRKPYLSSSNYILKMSNYSRGSWADEWDYRYRKFILDHEEEMKPYAWSYRIYPKWKKQVREYEEKKSSTD